MAAELTPEERSELARLMMDVFDEWGVEPAMCVSLLGLPADTRTRTMLRYRNGQPLPETDELLLRARQLLEIQHSLRNAFPMNAAMAKYWISTENTRFANRTPLAVMLEEGLPGIERIRRHLDASDEWGE